MWAGPRARVRALGPGTRDQGLRPQGLGPWAPEAARRQPTFWGGAGGAEPPRLLVKFGTWTDIIYIKAHLSCDVGRVELVNLGRRKRTVHSTAIGKRVDSRETREQQYGRVGQWQVEHIGPQGARGPMGAPRAPISPWVWALWGPRAPLGPALGPGPYLLNLPLAKPAI